MTADQILGWLAGFDRESPPCWNGRPQLDGRQGVKLSQVQVAAIMQPQGKEALLQSRLPAIPAGTSAGMVLDSQ